MSARWLFLLCAFAAVAVSAEDAPRKGGKKGGGGGEVRRVEVRMPAPAFRTDVPDHDYDLILCRPTDRAVTLSVLCYDEREGYVTFGPESDKAARRTAPQHFAKGEPAEIVLGALEPGMRYFYRFHSRRMAAGEDAASDEGSFMTARPRGSAFTFTIQADPHLDFGIDPPTYVKSLRNAVAAHTDFHIDLGDTFMTDKYPKYTDAFPQYLAERYYFGIVGAAAPVFLVLGNHDGEQLGRDGDDAMAVWSNLTRKKFFPNPVPNEFYTGDATPRGRAGLLEDYYAWEWGDALFVALNPFWYSPRPRGNRGDGPVDNWSWTLGREQYDWLARVLAGSRAKFKFVFIHHLVGGATPEARGGAEASNFFEWGGKDIDGRDTFAQHRPGWRAPIHTLLVQQHVSAVFHGHDHVYAQQERDGIIYQLVPQPGHSRIDTTRSATEYGYKSGVIAGASGILRVKVSPEAALVEYVRAYPDKAESPSQRTGAVTQRYSLAGH